jgi:hypothetical protein
VNVCASLATFSSMRRWWSPHNTFLLERYLEAHVLRKTLIVFAAAVVFGSLPVATDALAAHGGHAGGHAAAGHVSGGRASGGHVAHYGGGHGYRYGGGYGRGYHGGPIYDSCAGYGDDYGYGYNNGCRSYGVVPLVGGIVNGVLGGYER